MGSELFGDDDSDDDIDDERFLVRRCYPYFLDDQWPDEGKNRNMI